MTLQYPDVVPHFIWGNLRHKRSEKLLKVDFPVAVAQSNSSKLLLSY